MRTTVGRGLIAGAAGVTALNWVGYADMALRGRPAGDTPARLTGTALDRLGVALPGSADQRATRLDALGALAGIKVGLLVGVGAAVARRAGIRLPAPVAIMLTGAAAMAASDGPVAALGVSDPRTWSAADWASDVVPHLAYGAATHAVLTAFERHDAPRRARTGIARRAFVLGWACGGRTSFGPAALALTARKPVTGIRRARSIGAVLSATGEIVVDKLPTTPSRLEPQVLGGRIASGAGSGGSLAYREDESVWVPIALGAAGAAAGSYAGAFWRRWAVQRMPDWQAAVAEDIVTLVLARSAARPA
ncbi:hypothetical protein acdb102_25300 [Acidothermaceae bacterium B102]|nr:hypothetical protein acdb102_25300 [Acidothermaceae bacterium B102]